MATTTNYNWETPDDNDLVKDGAAAIRTLGNSVDTTTKALNPSTTLGDIEYRSSTSNTNARLGIGSAGQVLTVASGVPSWATPNVGDITAVNVSSPITGGGSSGDVTISIQDGTTAQKGAVQLENSTSSTSTTTAAVPASVKSAYDLANAAIPKSLVDAAGDLIYATANDTVARLALGTAGQVLKVNSGATAPEWGAISSGKLLQVVQGTKTDTTSTTSQTFVTTNLSLSITPSSSNSKILVWVMGSFGLDPNQSNVYASLFRDSTAIIQGDAAGNRARITTMNYVGNGNFGGQASIVYLDSPASTSALTYALYYRSSEGGTVYLNRTSGDNNATTYSPRSASTIVAMEIGA